MLIANRNSRMTSCSTHGIATTSIEVINFDETYDIPADIYKGFLSFFLLQVEDDSMNRTATNGYALVNPSPRSV